MPIFEFRCLHCQSEFEKLVFSSQSESEITCPDCESHEIEKMFSAFNGVSRSNDGSTRSLSTSSCSSCHASSCASCKSA